MPRLATTFGRNASTLSSPRSAEAIASPRRPAQWCSVARGAAPNPGDVWAGGVAGRAGNGRTRRRTANRLCCDVGRCPDNPGRAMAIFVRCIDNTLAADVLVVGEIYGGMQLKQP